MSDFWLSIRKDFPITEKYLYFDHAAAGPMPRPVKEAFDQYLKEQSEEADFAWMRWIRRREEARASIAKLIHASPDEIAFTQNTSQGMNFVAEMIAGEGTLLTNTSEFPTSTLPWIWRKTPVVWQKPDAQSRLPLSELQTYLNPKIKTLVSSHVQYATGFRQDLETLGKIKGKRFFVANGAQSLGAFPVDVEAMNIDFFVCNSFKWMMSGYGGGVLYVRKKWLKRFKPKTFGWRSGEDPDAMQNRKAKPSSRAVRYELGGPGLPNTFALGRAAEYFLQIGTHKIAQRILDLTGHLMKGLEEKGFEVLSPRADNERSGIVIVKVRDPQFIWKKLMSKGVCVSPRGGGIRVAPHFYNTHDELDRFVNILQTC